MAKARARRRSRELTIPVAAVAGFMPLVAYTVSRGKTGGIQGALSGVCAATTGWDTTSGSWDYKLMWHGTFPIILGLLVHKIAGKMGVNRTLASANVPFLRI